MGIYDRGYYSDDEWKRGGEDPRGMGRPRSVVVTLVIINVVIFLADMFSGASSLPGTGRDDDQRKKQDHSLNLSVLMGLKHGTAEIGFPGPLDNPLSIWQMMSYGFAHASITSERGLMHVAFNMIALFMLGRPVEQRYGSGEFLRFYLVAIVVAAIVWLMSCAILGRPAWAVGASGAVAAVVMLFVFNFPREIVLLFGVIPIPAWVLGVVMVVGDMLTSLNAASGVAVEMHFAGAAFAAAYFYGKWNLAWLRFDGLARVFSRRPKLKVHNPRGPSDESLSSEADQVLLKLHREGESSLTRRERKILEKYSREVRERRGD